MSPAVITPRALTHRREPLLDAVDTVRRMTLLAAVSGARDLLSVWMVMRARVIDSSAAVAVAARLRLVAYFLDGVNIGLPLRQHLRRPPHRAHLARVVAC